MTKKIGYITYEKYKARVVAIAKGLYKPPKNEPKNWREIPDTGEKK